MRLAHTDWRFVIPFRENEAVVLALEHPVCYREKVYELLRQCEGEPGRFVLSKDFVPIELNKHAVMLTDVFQIDMNGRKQTTQLLKSLTLQAAEGVMFEKTARMKTEVMCWVGDLAQQAPYSICYREEPDVSAMLKAMNVGFPENEGSPRERLVEYMKIAASFLNASLFIAVGLHACLTQEELRQVYRAAFLEKLHVLVIEPRVPALPLPEERLYVVDSDLCEIYNDTEPSK